MHYITGFSHQKEPIFSPQATVAIAQKENGLGFDFDHLLPTPKR